MPLHQCASSLHCSYGTYKDNLSNNQEIIEFDHIFYFHDLNAWGYKNEGNDHQQQKLLIVEQILLVSTLGNV